MIVGSSFSLHLHRLLNKHLTVILELLFQETESGVCSLAPHSPRVLEAFQLGDQLRTVDFLRY